LTQENTSPPEKVIVLHPVLPVQSKEQRSVYLPEDRLAEAIGLARAIRLDVVHSEIVTLSRITPATLLGRGVVERIKTIAEAEDVGLVYIDHPLTPVQQRNLEKALHAKVIDRTGLILEIFGERARTKEGQLQVELAALEFQRSRLVRSWTHLERQRGGYGFTGGPGETQIEIDRRLIGERIAKLKTELEQVRKNRRLQRQSRERVPFPVAALVGYTNAGKSTLFNALTGAEVFAEDLLFATLDPTMRACLLPSGRKIIMSDTVGFISDLPTHLIAAFRATLEEVENASVIIYMRDVTHPDAESERESVKTVLAELGIEIDNDERVFEVLNKADLLAAEEREALAASLRGSRRSFLISAETGAGCEVLLEAVDDFLARDEKRAEVRIDTSQDSEAMAWLYRHSHVYERRDREHISRLRIRLSEKNLNRFVRQYPQINLRMLLEPKQDQEKHDRTAKA
jgi:GTP-binding protein HflX